ncbi:MAG: zinc-dependent alcohol dehydrogenase family protein [Rhodospirillales bacterium]|nr:zinc-dependent alcohol dehydrogenase family protein [Rhodospirillales bacterium]
MKHVTHSEIGLPAKVLRIEEKASASLAAGEARVAVLATPIHPSNLLQISGQYGQAPQLPATPGSEGVGRVTEVAPDVKSLKIGQSVMLAGGNTWQQELTGPAEAFIPLPDGADVLQLSMLTVNPITAYLLLKNFADLKEGDWVVQSAANSAVGGYLIQLAKKRGIKTINIVRRENGVQELLDLGADHVLVDGPDLVEQIGAITSGAPLSLAIDAVGGETFSKMVDTLTYGGTIVCYGALSMTEPSLSSRAVIFNDVKVRGFWLSKWFETATPADKQAAFGEIIGLVASGTLKAKVSQTFSLDQIKDAVTAAAESGRDGKVILVPNKL